MLVCCFSASHFILHSRLYVSLSSSPISTPLSLPLSLPLFVDHTNAGYLSPEVQIRNLKLFGAVTSEERYREEHDRFMVTKRKLLWPQHQPGFEASTYVEEESDEKTAISKL